MYGYAQHTILNDSHGETGGEEVLALCEQHGIPKVGDKMAKLAHQRGVSEAQLNIARLLHKSLIMLPILGTSSVAHLRENLQAADNKLSTEDMTYLG